jgi:thioredoxin 1
MTTVQLTTDNFEETVSADGITLVDFWAAWCGPCRMFGPVYDRVSERHTDVVFGKVDTEAQPELAGAFQISSIPTLMIARDGIVVYSQAGALPEPALEELIAKARELDMDEVRRQIAQEQQQGASR